MPKPLWFKYVLVRALNGAMGAPGTGDMHPPAVQVYTHTVQAPDVETAKKICRRKFKYENGHGAHETVVERIEPTVGR